MHDNSKVGKFIVFQIADYLFALPMSDVLRVINCPPVASGGLRAMGIVQLGQHTIRVLDLHQQLGARQSLAPVGGLPNLPEFPDNQAFLVITRSSQGELCGIAVDEPPNLMDLPLEMIRSLPPSGDRSSVFNLVSHAIGLSQEEVTTTIFLLDVQRVLNTAKLLHI